MNWPELNELLKGKENNAACQKLIAFLKISNIYVGDAIANLLLLEAIMRDKGMSIQAFSEIYCDNPSQLDKVKVADRFMFKPIWDESRLEEPKDLQ